MVHGPFQRFSQLVVKRLVYSVYLFFFLGEGGWEGGGGFTVVCDSQACSGPDVGLLVGAILIVLALLWCVYCVIVRENRAKKMDSFALVSILCSQFVALFQMLGVLNTLSVAWPEPFATIVEMGTLVNFRLEVLNVTSAASCQRRRCTDTQPTRSLSSSSFCAWWAVTSCM